MSGRLLTFIGIGIAVLAGFFLDSPVVGGAREVVVIEFEGAINPGTATYVKRGIGRAADRGAEAVVIQLDTPGGLASSMRSIIKEILNSPVPVVVFVGPKGAGAASAGVMVTVAGHIAAMAPGTNIGAAHPVMAGGRDIGKAMSEKVVHDMAAYGRGIAEEKGRNGDWVERAIRESVSITAEEAVSHNVVDLMAEDIDTLLYAIDGRTVEVKGTRITLDTDGASVVYYRPGFRDRVLKTISDPNIAYILMMVGLAGIYFELSNPGAILPGVIGGISLILAFYSFQTLPVNYAGLLLIVLGIIFFIAEIMVSSFGVLAIGGLISLTIGSIMLFEDVGVSIRLLLPTIVLVAGFFLVVTGLAVKAFRSRTSTGSEGLVGSIGAAMERLDPEGLISIHGETWRARASEPIERGAPVEVERLEGLKLHVKRAADVGDFKHNEKGAV
ncbi:MAG TPA: nodulation protein NfeD [Desulfobacteraceae bacterium]|nr:nodulation protein NfeD [Desulfobacteraceae bacterium]